MIGYGDTGRTLDNVFPSSSCSSWADFWPDLTRVCYDSPYIIIGSDAKSISIKNPIKRPNTHSPILNVTPLLRTPRQVGRGH